MPDPRDRLIVALDVSHSAQALALVRSLGAPVSTYKVGKQLFTAEGPALVRELVAAGKKVFLDLKFHDIPATVAGAVGSASELGVSMLTVHASGGSKMLRAAVESARKATTPPLVLAVTVLTSLSDEDLRETGVQGRAKDQVLRLVVLARAEGCDGVVASPQEVRELRRQLGDGFAIVTPGVRPAGTAVNDQARTATPGEAIAAGATYVVVGRPITAANEPSAAARAILEEIQKASPAK